MLIHLIKDPSSTALIDILWYLVSTPLLSVLLVKIVTFSMGSKFQTNLKVKIHNEVNELLMYIKMKGFLKLKYTVVLTTGLYL